jgi:hypothetical protein
MSFNLPFRGYSPDSPLDFFARLHAEYFVFITLRVMWFDLPFHGYSRDSPLKNLARLHFVAFTLENHQASRGA